MDISALSDDNFDVTSWVNSTLVKCNDETSKEAVVSSLVSKLQLYVQQVNSALENTSQQVLASMPRIMKDAQALQAEGNELKVKMSEVQSNISQVHKETDTCMANLERLDSLKAKLTVAREGLQESDGWGKMIAELEDLFELSDLTKSCEKLKLLQKSFAAQAGLPGQAERELQIEGLKNRLEALSSTPVVQCFTNGDVDQSRYYVDIFRDIGRLPHIIQYYTTVQKQIWQQHWTETIELSQNTTSVQFLSDYYNYMFECFQKQQKWCTTVFGASECNTPAVIVAELLPNLQPSRENIVCNLLKHSEDKLSILESVSVANVHFGRMFVNTFADKHDSILLERLSNSIYNYFNTFIAHSTSIEEERLAKHASELQLCNSASENVRIFSSANGKVFQWADEALRRCASITQNCGLPAIVNVLNNHFKTTLDKYKKVQQQLHASRGNENDWNLLQNCISLLQHIGDFRLKLHEFEENVSKLLTQKYESLTNQNVSDPQSVLSAYKINDKRSKSEFKKLAETSRTLSNYEQQEGIFFAVFSHIKPICEYLHDTTLASIFTPIENQLKNILPDEHNASDASVNDLPDYSFVPQEFITIVGQYFLTLPQHLEPLLLTPNLQLKSALELCDERYGRAQGAASEACADVLLALLVDECCAMYSEQITQICQLSNQAAKQLACDIEYLSSVVEELGLSLNGNLQQTIKLLRAPADNYLVTSAGCDPRLVTAIRQKRNIVSKDK